MRKLPEACATTNLDGATITIRRDVEGYYLAPGTDIEDFNTMTGADEEAIKVMTCASMFGWDIPAVTNYEEEA